MNIIFTKHAKVRMFQREIAEEEIKSIVENPNNIISGSFKERTIARNKFPKGTLEVIYKESENSIVVITCYWVKNEE